jgi:hypothetical protein
MAFKEKLKKRVREEAAFRCCRCFKIGIEVHHIVPQAEDGADSFKNAAPLCPNCHSNFGDNPRKRKEIREMRNYLYERVRTDPILKENMTYIEELNRELIKDEPNMVKINELTKKAYYEDILDLSKSKQEYVEITDIKPASVRHEELSQNLKTRIANIGYLFGEIYPFTLEESIKNFKCNMNPEMEIEWWEAFARIYNKTINGKRLSLREKGKIYKRIFKELNSNNNGGMKVRVVREKNS